MRPRRCRQPSSKLCTPKLNAVHAGREVALEAAVLGGARIALHGDLGAGREAQPRRGGVEDVRRSPRAGTGSACRRRRTRCARCGPRPAAGPARGRRPARRRTRRPAAAPCCWCELKSQYGHLRTHHGMWMYSDSGGGISTAEQLRAACCQRLAAMADAVLQSPARARAAPRPAAPDRRTPGRSRSRRRRAARRGCGLPSRLRAISGCGSSAWRSSTITQWKRAVRAPRGTPAQLAQQLARCCLPRRRARRRSAR